MRLLADESIDGAIVVRLRADGHDVRYVAELDPGLADADALRQAHDAQRVLLTADRDFGELVFRPRHASAGVVLVRLAGLATSEKAVRVSAFCATYPSEAEGAFSVISPTSVRIRLPG